MKKGIICTLVALMIVFGFAGVAAADSGVSGGTISTTVTLNGAVAEGFDWEIPAALSVDDEAVPQAMSVINVVLSSYERKLTVSVTSNNSFNLKNASDTESKNPIPYKLVFTGIGGTTELTANGNVLSVAAGEDGYSNGTIMAEKSDDTKMRLTGDYTDNLQFTATIGNKT